MTNKHSPWAVHEREIDRVIDTKQPVQGKFSLHHERLGHRVYDYSFEPVFDDKGEVESVSGSIRDITEHKHTGRVLRESEEKYRTLFEKMDEGFCIIKMEFEDNKPVSFRYLEINPAFRRHTGLEGIEIEGKSAEEVLPNVGEDLLKRNGRVALTGEPLNDEVYVEEVDRWLNLSTFRVGDPEERTVAVLFNNITDRKANELANAYLGAIVDNSDDAIIGKNLDGIITSWNKSATRIFGYTAEEAVGQSITIIIPDERVNEEEDILTRIQKGERIDHFETVRRRKDGSLFDVSLTISPVKNSEGNIVGVSKIARDITKRKENELKSAWLSAIVEGSDDAIISKDLDSRITSWNNSAERMFGYTAEEAIGQPITMIFPKDRMNEEDDIIRRISRGEQVDHFETKRKCKDGTLLDISLTISPIKDSDGNIVGASKIARDITKRKEAEKKLESMNEILEERVKERTKKLRSHQRQLRSLASQLNKAEEQERQRLASELHDTLGQMLAVAKMKTDGLQHQNLPDMLSSEIKELKEVVEEALKYNQNLMLELKPPPMLDKEDVTEVILWTAKQVEKQGLNIDIKTDGQPKRVNKELRTTLYQCVRELLQNVLKHAETNEAQITVSTEQKNVEITIEDNGKGFHFTDDQVQGTREYGGFGLFNIKERMDWNGGSFEIESEPGKGTKAILYAPLKEKEKQLNESEEEVIAPSQKEVLQESLQQKNRVLLVDDHEMMRRGLRQLIEKQDDLTVVEEASDGKEALKLARETTPHIIIMDVNMPNMDGIEATQKIKAEMPGIRVIGLSLHDSPEVVEDMLSAGASDYLTKNEAFESLIATLRAKPLPQEKK